MKKSKNKNKFYKPNLFSTPPHSLPYAVVDFLAKDNHVVEHLQIISPNEVRGKVVSLTFDRLKVIQEVENQCFEVICLLEVL